MLFRQNGRTTQDSVGQLSNMVRKCLMSNSYLSLLIMYIVYVRVRVYVPIQHINCVVRIIVLYSTCTNVRGFKYQLR